MSIVILFVYVNPKSLIFKDETNNLSDSDQKFKTLILLTDPGVAHSFNWLNKNLSLFSNEFYRFLPPYSPSLYVDIT